MVPGVQRKHPKGRVLLQILPKTSRQQAPGSKTSSKRQRFDYKRSSLAAAFLCHPRPDAGTIPKAHTVRR